jgi:hypothetical protein
MARKKLTDTRKVERVKMALSNLVSDICTNKSSPELLGVAQSEIALCLAIIGSETDDELEIGKNWAIIENRIVTDRAIARGVTLSPELLKNPLTYLTEEKSDGQTKRQKGT